MRHGAYAGAILVVHPGAELYGSDRVVLEGVTGLVDTGHQVVVLLPARGALVGALTKVGARVVIGPSLVLRKKLLKPRNWFQLANSGLLGLLCAVRVLSQFRPDIVIVNTTILPLWPVIGRALGVRVVSHIHEADSEMPILLRRILMAPHLAADTIICNSEFTKTVLLEAYPQLCSRVRILYNGVNEPLEKVAARESIIDHLRVLYVGRLSPRKGPDLAIQAVKQLNAHRIPAILTLAGSAFEGMEWFEDELRAASIDGTGRSMAAFEGFVGDIWPLLAESDVLVVPSRLDESFGNTAVEGILAGRPVVVSDTSGLREAAQGYGSAIYVEPDSSAAIADALQRIYSSWTDFVEQAALDAKRAELRHKPATYRQKFAVLVTEGDFAL